MAVEIVALKKKLKQTAGDVKQLQDVLRHAERPGGPLSSDPRALEEVYGLAMRVFGPVPMATFPEEFTEVCCKRLALLQQSDPEEASLFQEFMASKHIPVRPVAKESSCCPGPSGPGVQAPPPMAPALRSSVQGAPPPQSPAARCRVAFADTGRGSVASLGANSTNTFEITATTVEARSPLPSRCTPQQETPLKSPFGELAGEAVLRREERFSEPSADVPPQVPPVEVIDLEAEEAELEDAEEGEALEPPVGQQAAASSQELPMSSPTAGDGGAATSPSAATAQDAGDDLETSHSQSQPTGEQSFDESLPPKTYFVNGVAYSRVRKIGKGGSGKVFEVAAPGLPQSFALKRSKATSPLHFEALEEEVRLLQQLKHCPHVMQLYDAETLREEGELKMVMELGDMDLGKLLQVRSNLNLGDVQALWRQMLEAVQGIHDMRIVHSDLKPANFLLANGRLKLIDFGIAKRIANETTNVMRDTPQGTISYMAPEALMPSGDRGLKMGRASDIWSLGIILYQVVYKRSPFAHLAPMQRAMALADPDLVIPFPPEHSLEHHAEATKAQLTEVLGMCLQRDPKRRATVGELLAHPFLQESSQQVSRSSFDRAMEAMVGSFYQMVDRAMLAEGIVRDASEGAAEDAAIQESRQRSWRALSDELWGSLCSESQSGRLASADAEASLDANKLAASASLDPFREFVQRWVSRGLKRQRTELAVARRLQAAEAEAAAAVGSAAGCTAPANGGSSSSSSSTGRGRPPGPAPPPKRHAAEGLHAPQLGSGGLGMPELAERSRLEPAKPPPRIALAAPGQVPVAQELLLHQRSCLRKPTTPEQAPASAARPPGGAQREGEVWKSDSVVMKRLQDRRAMIAADPEEELTSVTRWGTYGA